MRTPASSWADALDSFSMDRPDEEVANMNWEAGALARTGGDEVLNSIDGPRARRGNTSRQDHGRSRLAAPAIVKPHGSETSKNHRPLRVTSVDNQRYLPTPLQRDDAFHSLRRGHANQHVHHRPSRCVPL
jgi:hypothetical protein